MSKPIAVLISDIHYNINTLPLADAALRAAIKHANDLKVPLIIAGDLHDTKALMRAECVSALRATLATANTPPTILVGNHDLVNEKANTNALDFLTELADIVSEPGNIQLDGLNITLIPYQSDLEAFKKVIKKSHKVIICHQGVQGADMGHYVQDKTSLPLKTFEGKTVISGHYHKRQTLKCGKSGTFSYIGNPYTLTFGEANDPVKGYQLLNDDLTITHVPLNLRKHVIIENTLGEVTKAPHIAPEDLVWLKIKGPKTSLDKIDKKEFGMKLLGHNNYKLDLIPTDPIEKLKQVKQDAPPGDRLDALIDNTTESGETKDYMKSLWREVYQ